MNRMTDFDPYDMLVDITQRLARLESAHNKMAQAYQQHEQEVTITLHTLKQLQIQHQSLLQKMAKLEFDLKSVDQYNSLLHRKESQQ
jgi:hypothetical protein